MKKSNLFLSGLLLAASFATVSHAADVGVSVNISQPGFYGRIDVGRVPAPAVIYAQPMVIEQHPMTVARQPIYLRVPPGHEKHWDRHCAQYNACGQPVYFVQDNWYREVYTPQYQGGRDRGDRGDRRDGGDRGDRRDGERGGHRNHRRDQEN
jgi:hypothetical protein